MSQDNVLYTYRYVSKKKDSDDLFVTYRTGSMQQHKTYCDFVLDDPDIISCIREYINSIDLDKIALIDSVKEEKKDEEGGLNV